MFDYSRRNCTRRPSRPARHNTHPRSADVSGATYRRSVDAICLTFRKHFPVVSGSWLEQTKNNTIYRQLAKREGSLSLSLTSTANKKTSTKVLFTQSYGKRIVPPWTIPPSDISSYHARLWLELEVGLVGLGLVGLSLWFGLGGTVREGNCQGECPTLNRITLLTSRRYLIPRTLAPPLDTCPRGQTVYAAECKRNIK